MPNHIVTEKGVFIGSPDEFEEFGTEGQPFFDRDHLDENEYALLAGKPLNPEFHKNRLVKSSDVTSKTVVPLKKWSSVPRDGETIKTVIKKVNAGYKYKQPNIGAKKKGKGVKGISQTMKQQGDPYEIAEHLIKVNDHAVVDHLGIVNHRIEEFEPQVFISQIARVPDLSWLAMIAFKIVNSAYSRGIGIHDFIVPTAPAVTISSPYLAYLAICMDLYLMLSGEVTIFSEMPTWYWFMRNAFTPRVWKGKRDYVWRMDGQPTLEDWLLSLPATAPFVSGVQATEFGLAIPTGAEDPDGYALLSAGASTGWTLDDIKDIGAPVVHKMMTAMCMNQSEVQMKKDTGSITPTVAAFMPVYPFPNNANETVALVTCADSVAGHHVWLSELRVVVPSNGGIEIGKHFTRCHTGPVVWGYIIQYGLDPWEGVNFQFKPKQISVSQILLSILTMFLQADIINAGTPPHGNPVQDPDSLILGFGAADFANYVLSLVVKRFSQQNTVYFGTKLPQDSSVWLAGGSDQTYAPFDALAYPLASQIIEDMARIVMFELPMSKNAKQVEIRMPLLCGFGGKEFNANPLDISGPSMSVTSALSLMYPNATWQTYVFGAAYSSKYPVTFAPTTYSKFFGSTPAGLRRQVGSMFGFSSQNFPTGSAMANVDNMDETLLYYTVVASPYSGQPTTFDYATSLGVHSMVNKYAFDPRHALNDTRTLPLGICELAAMWEYTISFDETKSMDFSTSVAVLAMQQELNVNNKYSGYPSEASESTKTAIKQCLGGGFLLKLGRIAGRVFKAAPSIFDAISSAFSGQSDAPAKQAFMGKVVNHLLRISHRNPYSPLLRVVENNTSIDHIGGHRLRV